MVKVFEKYQTALVIIAIAILAFFVGMYSNSADLGSLGNALSGAAGAAGSVDDVCDTTVLSASEKLGLVLADPLNFRRGPSLNSTVITGLNLCTLLTLEGRTEDGQWLQVTINGSDTGWVFSFYVYPNIDIMSELDVTAGFGGEGTDAGGEGSPSDPGSVTVYINLNQAAAFVSGMPANTNLTAVLSPSGNPSNGVIVTTGSTNVNGSVTLLFDMPETWDDGASVESGAMDLVITGGGETITAYLTYYTLE